MAKAQTTMEQPQKTKVAKITYGGRNGSPGREKSYKYCDIADILKVALPTLGAQSLAFFQMNTPTRSETFTAKTESPRLKFNRRPRHH